MKINWAILPKSIVVNFDGKTKNISIDNKEVYGKILDAIKNKREDEIPRIVDTLSQMSKIKDKNVSVENGYITIDGETINNHFSNKVIQYYANNIPYTGLVNFWRNLRENPSHSARERLFLFLEHGGHPFTDDGHFIAYKAVTSTFKDIRTETIDNSIGAKPSMPRGHISDNPTITCDVGLHVAAFSYLTEAYSKSSSTYICVKVNPKNVVCIPIDYNNKKMRVCEYEVISLSESPIEQIHYESNKDTESSEIPSDLETSDSSESSESSEDKVEEIEPIVVECQPLNSVPPDFVLIPSNFQVNEVSEESSSSSDDEEY